MPIELEQAPPPRPVRDAWPRRYNRPQIVHPITGDTLNCYSPSKLGDYLGLGFSNPTWTQRHVIKGAGIAPHIAAKAAPLNVDTDRAELDQLVNQAAEAGGVTAKADYGTMCHSALRRLIRRQDVDLPPEFDTWAAQVRALIDEWDLRLAWEHSDEVFVVDPGLPAAGEADAYVTTNQTGSHIVTLDLKTGKSVKAVPVAMQLAAYANASHYAELVDGEPVLYPMPGEVNKRLGLVLHAPINADPPALIGVDICEGYRLARTAVSNHQQTLNDKRLRVGLDHAQPEPEPEPEPETQPEPEPETEPEPDKPTRGRRFEHPLRKEAATLTARLKRLIDTTDATMQDVKEGWPAGVPGLKDHLAHTNETLDLVAGWVTMLELEHGTTQTDIDQIAERLAQLPPDLYERTDIQAKASDPPVPHLKHNPTRHDLNRLDILVTAAEKDAKQRLTRIVDAIHDHAEANQDQYVAWATETSEESLETADGDNLARLTEHEAERVISLAHLFDRGDIDLTTELVDHCGTKTAVIAAAKSVAAEHGLPRPTSTATVTKDRLLAALILNNPNHKKEDT